MAEEKPSLDDILNISFEELSSLLKKTQELQESRKKHPYVGDLIKLLFPYENGLRRSLILHELEKQRRKDGLPIPENFEQSVQSSYNQYSVDSDVFRKRGAPETDGLFYAPGGKGSGKWAVNKPRAVQWLKK